MTSKTETRARALSRRSGLSSMALNSLDPKGVFARRLHQWLDNSATSLESRGYASIHLDELDFEFSISNPTRVSLFCLETLVTSGLRLAGANRLFIEIPILESSSVVPLDAIRQSAIWSKIDSTVSPSLSVVSLKLDHILVGDENYRLPIDPTFSASVDGLVLGYYTRHGLRPIETTAGVPVSNHRGILSKLTKPARHGRLIRDSMSVNTDRIRRPTASRTTTLTPIYERRTRRTTMARTETPSATFTTR